MMICKCGNRMDEDSEATWVCYDCKIMVHERDMDEKDRVIEWQDAQLALNKETHEEMEAEIKRLMEMVQRLQEEVNYLLRKGARIDGEVD